MAFLGKVTRNLRRLSAGDTGLYGFTDCVDDDGGGHIRVRHTRTRLLLQALLVTVLLVGVGVTGVFADNALQRVGGEQVRTAAQLSKDAQGIYESLAKADSSATGYLLFNTDRQPIGQPAPQTTLWGQHEDASGLVAERLVSAAGLTGGDISRAGDITKISLQFSLYINMMGKARGLVDGAREAIASTEDETGNSVERGRAVGQALLGAAYTRQASSYLREVLLRAVMKFRDHETANLRDARDAALWTWVSHLLLLLAGLGGLAWIQWSLARRTHRFLNYGLLGATVLMVVTLGVTVRSLQNWPQTETGFVKIGKELANQRDLIDTERKMLNASADINLLLGGASSLTWDDFNKKFEENIRCAKQIILCHAYKNLIYKPLVKGKSTRAMVAALPGGKFAQKFDEVNQDNVTKINAGEIGRAHV